MCEHCRSNTAFNESLFGRQINWRLKQMLVLAVCVMCVLENVALPQPERCVCVCVNYKEAISCILCRLLSTEVTLSPINKYHNNQRWRTDHILVLYAACGCSHTHTRAHDESAALYAIWKPSKIEWIFSDRSCCCCCYFFSQVKLSQVNAQPIPISISLYV